MSFPTRSPLWIVGPLLMVLLLIIGLTLLFPFPGRDLKSRAAAITVGMTRAQVEDILGPPVIELPRMGGRGTLLSWVDQLWQVDVRTGPGDQVETVSYMPSHSFLRKTVGRVVPLPK